MQTHFSPQQLSDPGTLEAEKVLRTCVHCGFCNATCPTYVLTGSELDSPRGRIYMIKDMLERDQPAAPSVLTHIDRCLSCLSCMTTCPSGVHYMHLVDQARHHIERTHSRPLPERFFRRALATVLTHPALFRVALAAARIVRPLKRFMPKSVAALLARANVTPAQPSPLYRPQIFRAVGTRRKRVALLTGCVQQVLQPAIDAATVSILTRHGCDVVIVANSACCGALAHHLGQDARQRVMANVDAWTKEIEHGGFDAIVANASGCGTMLKDYGFLLRDNPDYATKANCIAGLAKDISEVLATLELNFVPIPRLRVAYQGACSLQHGQRLQTLPKNLLTAAGFRVLDIPEGHLCCGSAGTYNLLQPAMAEQLKHRKAEHIAHMPAEVVAAGNIGCIMQLADAVRSPVVHTVALLDWATGGPQPAELSARL